MERTIHRLPASDVLSALGGLFRAPASDRHVYCVFGPYRLLRPFQDTLRRQVAAGAFASHGKVEYVSLAYDLIGHLRDRGEYDEVSTLADRARDEEFRRRMSRAFRDLVTRKIEAAGTAGLVLADFELLYAYDLGGNDISLVRQVAINGRRVCLLVPGAMHDGRLFIFDEDDEARREFPDTLVFHTAGWVFELTDGG